MGAGRQSSYHPVIRLLRRVGKTHGPEDFSPLLPDEFATVNWVGLADIAKSR